MSSCSWTNLLLQFSTAQLSRDESIVEAKKGAMRMSSDTFLMATCNSSPTKTKRNGRRLTAHCLLLLCCSTKTSYPSQLYLQWFMPLKLNSKTSFSVDKVLHPTGGIRCHHVLLYRKIFVFWKKSWCCHLFGETHQKWRTVTNPPRDDLSFQIQETNREFGETPM